MTGIVKKADLIDFYDLEALIKDTYGRSIDVMAILEAGNESIHDVEVPDTNDPDDEQYS